MKTLFGNQRPYVLIDSRKALIILLLSFFGSAGGLSPQLVAADSSNKIKVFTPILNKSIILPVYPKLPNQNESIIEPTTGLKLTRLTDSDRLDGTSDAFVSYSRYTPENSSGNLFLAFGSNSISSWVIERKTGETIAKLTKRGGKTIGENHEIRWDNSGKHPNRLYYRDGMRLIQIDNVYDHIKTTSTIKDFSKQFPESTLVYNDVEGDSSDDSDHWAFMAVHYNGTTNVVDAFIHYQISTDTTHSLTTKQLSGTKLGHYAERKVFPRPNMVEISPNGDGIVLHYERAWGNKEYGNRHKDINTWFDGAYLWPLDFNIEKQKPRKISVSSTHSGWSWGNNEESYFISQNNRTDYIEAVPLSPNKRSIIIGSHRDMGWSTGFHFGKMPKKLSNWSLVSTYGLGDEKEEWALNQIFLLELKSIYQNNRIVRIGPTYNHYDGEYRDEAIAAINLEGNRVYFSSNWGGSIQHREIFMYELPENWQENLRHKNNSLK
ncbi:MAG: hypothetical protein K6L75_05625 [Cellvibrionaceae bacterium]